MPGIHNTLVRDAYEAEMLTVSDSVETLTASKINPTSGLKVAAQAVLITVADQSIRYWVSGDTPTASVGHLVPAGSSIEIHGNNNLKNFKAIRATGADAEIAVTYMR